MMREAPPIEEAPVARAGPRSPDAFYRGEEAGADLKPADSTNQISFLPVSRKCRGTEETVRVSLWGQVSFS